MGRVCNVLPPSSELATDTPGTGCAPPALMVTSSVSMTSSGKYCQKSLYEGGGSVQSAVLEKMEMKLRIKRSYQLPFRKHQILGFI